MKVWKRRTAVLLTAVLLAGGFSGESERIGGTENAGLKIFPGTLVVSAASSTQQQINEAEERRQELEEQRNENEEALEGLQGEQKALQRELNNLNEQLNQVAANLESLEQQIRDKEQEIADTRAALEEARATEQWQYECMVDRARALYEMNEDSYLNALLKEKSLAGILNAADFIEKVAIYEQRKMEEYRATRIYIEEQEARLQGEKNELDMLKLQAEAEQETVLGLISRTSNAIANYGDQIEEAEKRAREVEEKLKKEEENLEYLRKKLAEEIALSQAAANAAWRDISEVTFSEGDRKLLANLIYCEAGGEPYAGQLAVGSVVINRVLSSKFPDSVVGVIYQRKQFSPVASGRLELALASNRATESCYRAADEAMSGMTNVGNCVFFRTPIPGLTGISIGGHIFY
ncbi:MAG: cell wall hydrolase [Butyrivibrio sp.]|nr:cell wall hydrolase [Butyrivibrio sp.]